MPHRSKILTRGPLGDITVIGGGGGGGPGVVDVGPWGPDFGEEPGSDGVTFRSSTEQLPLSFVAVAGTDQVVVAVDLEFLALANTDQIVAAVDLENLTVAGTDQIVADVDLGFLALANTTPVVSDVSLDFLAVANTDQIDTQMTGVVFGPPQIRDSAFSETSTGLGGGSASVNVPTHVSGDLLLVVVNANANANPTADQGGWTVAHSVNNGVAYQRFFWRIATGAEPASYSFSNTTAVTTTGHILLDMYSIVGADPTTPVDDAQSATATDRTTTVSVAAATSSTPFSLVFACGLIVNTTNATQPNYTWTQPSGYLELVDHEDGPATPLIANPLVDSSTARIFDAGAGAIAATTFAYTPQPLIATTVLKIGTHIVIARDVNGVPIP